MAGRGIDGPRGFGLLSFANFRILAEVKFSDGTRRRQNARQRQRADLLISLATNKSNRRALRDCPISMNGRCTRSCVRCSVGVRQCVLSYQSIRALSRWTLTACISTCAAPRLSRTATNQRPTNDKQARAGRAIRCAPARSGRTLGGFQWGICPRSLARSLARHR